MKRITFLLPNSVQPRFYKRIDELSKLDIHTNIFAFERKYFQNNNLKYQYYSLGHISHGKYYKRLIPLFKALFLVWKRTKEDDVIYAFGFDMLFLSGLINFFSLKKRKIVYELGDIRNQMIEATFKAGCLRFLERILLKQVFSVVVTSKAFITEYFEGIQKIKPTRYHVIENKAQRDTTYNKFNSKNQKDKSVITIGYFGLLRCKKSLEVLQKAVEQGKGKYKVFLRGIPFGPVKDIKKYIEDDPLISYGGAYEAPNDLPGMYDEVDLVWACYPYSSQKTGNHLWARTNRFYEACSFEKPVFVDNCGEDAKSVRDMNIGMALDLDDIDFAVEKILNLSQAEVSRWKQNIKNLSEGIYQYKDEHEILFKELFGEGIEKEEFSIINYRIGNLSGSNFLFLTNTNWHDEPPRARHLLAKEVLDRGGSVHFVQRCNSLCKKDELYEKLFLYSFPGSNLFRKISCLIPPMRMVLDKIWKYFLDKKVLTEKNGKLTTLNFRYDFPMRSKNPYNQSFYICNDEFTERQPWFARWILKSLEINTAKASDRVFVISNHLKKKFQMVGINSTQFFPGGQKFPGYTPFFRKIDFNLKIKLGYIGFINDRFEFKVIKQLLKSSLFEISLIGPVEQKARRELNDLIASGVHYEGAKVGIDFVNSISKFDGVILPYKLTKATIGIEIPNKLFPALQTGRPIFISKLPNLHDFDEDLITTIPLNQKKWAKIIMNRLENESQEKFRKRIDFAKKYTWGRSLKIILKSSNL